MNNINLRSPLAVALLAMVVGACENPVSHEHHSDPEGIVIRAGSTELVRVAGTGTGAVMTGSIDVSAGGESPDLTVTFIDHDGEDLTLDADEYSLDVRPTSSAATWQGSAAGSFTGRITGQEAGATTLEFQLYHGGHTEGPPYVVPVTVTAMQP